ncbi:DUF4175 family protein [Hyphomonas sp. FCG-A18]|uniref:DUF4175 domain-containing protein n=1 Tax=Hyphomonas sp. FCG-A18 TaxID=3080019 RepID=UPI002B313782|nr:DUF4175 family protein [Hyphomonas sp. FCG-A18]
MADLNRIPGVKSRIARTYRRLRDIAVWRSFWPFIAACAAFLCLALLGLHERLPTKLAALSTLAFLIFALITALRGLRHYRGPNRNDAVRELDHQSDLRPLSSLQDRPARPEAEGVMLWRAHEQRLTDAIRRLKVPTFRDIWRRADPFMFRAILPAAIISLLVANGTGSLDRLSKAFSPDYGSLLGAENIRIEAWITPPDYSGRAPIFLDRDENTLEVPAGSVVTVRAQAPSAPKLRLDGQRRETLPFAATPDGAFEVTATLKTNTTLSVRWWGERQSWTIRTAPDNPPKTLFVSMPTLGENDETEFTWAIEDDYGVAKLELAIRPESDPTRAPDLIPIELGALNPTELTKRDSIDLTRNRWAGSRVIVNLVATDAAGQMGVSDTYEFILPSKLLLQPLAKAIQDARVTLLREDNPYDTLPEHTDSLVSGAFYTSATQRLGTAPEGIQRGHLMLDAITYGTPDYIRDLLVYTSLRSAMREIEAASNTETSKALDEMLWAVSLRAEYGTSADAYARLLAARNALEEALRDGASEEEIQRLTEAFRQAAMNYLAARMAEAMANGLAAPQQPQDGAAGGQGPNLGGQDFADMLDALEELAETGAADQARQLLSDITNMLENLNFQQGGAGGDGMPGLPGQQGDGSEDENVPQEERELSDTMRELSDILRQQRNLNDETLAQQRGERNGQGQQGQNNQPGGQGPGSEAPGGSGEQSLAEQQDRLADLVDRLIERSENGEFGAGGIVDEDALEAIERAQRRAGNALEEGNELRALRNQENATEQLRDLAEDLAAELDALRAARLGEQFGNGTEPGGSDPFGRSPNGGIGSDSDVDIPDQLERQRALDILEELRRRYGDTIDEEEREYLERLLDRF